MTAARMDTGCKTSPVGRDGFRKVVEASECDGDLELDELECPCGNHYGTECVAPGPHQDDLFEYEERPDGVYARALPEARS